MESLETTHSVELFRYLRTLVDSAEASRSSHPKFALVEAYWHIGQIVVEIEQQGQQRADYGIHLIESLSQKLTEAFGQGYSLPNMWRFKQFFLAFQILSTNGREFEKLHKYLRVELCWSHYRILMQLKNLAERTFYMQQAADEQWTVRFMQRMVRTRYYYQVGLGERRLLADDSDSSKRLGQQQSQTSAPTLSAIGGTPRTRLASIRKILLEQYVGYAFVAQRQFVSVAGQDRWVELVFFHYVLNRFVLIQLGEHDPTDTAQFQLMLDGYASKQPPTIDKPPIGFLLNKLGQIHIITSSSETVLPADELLTLPQALT
jgi:predicted nuclease of restriction endonuclease-like (RecB) superfamily